jgi:hypothetical protein
MHYSLLEWSIYFNSKLRKFDPPLQPLCTVLGECILGQIKFKTALIWAVVGI